MNTLRSCIVAEEGYTFISLDASQIELRVLALLSQDPQMLEDLRTGDLHMATAIRMLGWTADETEMLERRYQGKQSNFALLYGADEYKLAEMLGCSVEEALQFMEEHERAYPTLYQWKGAKITEAREKGYVVNMLGRIRPLPELFSGSWSAREKAEREVVNSLTQGTAVDIVKLAMLYLREKIGREVRLVMQVHDEILWECPDSLLASTLLLCKELEQAFPNYPFDTAIGKCYGELLKLGGDYASDS